MARLCHEGAAHRCFGPWYACAIFGCAVGNPRPYRHPTPRQAAQQEEHEARKAAMRGANLTYITGKLPEERGE